MDKRKQRSRDLERPRDGAAAGDIPWEESHVAVATPRAVRVASTLLVIHFVLLFVSLGSNYAPSSLQGRLLDWASIYLVTTNQDYGALPLELTHGSSVDFPIWVEVRRGESPDWDRLRLPGETRRVDGTPDYRGSHWPNLSRLIQLISLDAPDAELLSDLTARLLMAHGVDQRVVAVRLIAPTVLSYDQYSMLAAGQEDLIQDELQPEVVYSARVIHESSGTVRLLPDQEAMRTSKATGRT